ncbi:MAG: cupin domain-containing protein [Phycisphaerae bacterium]|nr:cupin domain-containing protein [Phycisphaerae bacterium]
MDASTNDYTFVPDLLAAQEIPAEGILTRTILNTPYSKAVLFTFSQGQELSEHTASVPALLHILMGKARIGLGADKVDAGQGSWIHMPANMKHCVRAETPLVMLLVMLKKPGQ